MRADKADKGGQLSLCPGGAGGGQHPPLKGGGGYLSDTPPSIPTAAQDVRSHNAMEWGG